MLTLIALLITFIVLARVVAYMLRKIPPEQSQTESSDRPKIILSPKLQSPPPDILEGKQWLSEGEAHKEQEGPATQVVVNYEKPLSEEDREALTTESKLQVPEVKVISDEAPSVKAEGRAQVEDLQTLAPRKVVRIGGIDINGKSIAQGIVISEILRRPDF